MMTAMVSVDGEKDPPERTKVDSNKVTGSNVFSFVTKTTKTLLKKL